MMNELERKACEAEYKRDIAWAEYSFRCNLLAIGAKKMDQLELKYLEAKDNGEDQKIQDILRQIEDLALTQKDHEKNHRVAQEENDKAESDYQAALNALGIPPALDVLDHPVSHGKNDSVLPQKRVNKNEGDEKSLKKNKVVSVNIAMEDAVDADVSGSPMMTSHVTRASAQRRDDDDDDTNVCKNDSDDDDSPATSPTTGRVPRYRSKRRREPVTKRYNAPIPSFGVKTDLFLVELDENGKQTHHTQLLAPMKCCDYMEGDARFCVSVLSIGESTLMPSQLDINVTFEHRDAHVDGTDAKRIVEKGNPIDLRVGDRITCDFVDLEVVERERELGGNKNGSKKLKALTASKGDADKESDRKRKFSSAFSKSKKESSLNSSKYDGEDESSSEEEPSSEKEQEDDYEPSPYELQREANVRRNQDRLRRLGILEQKPSVAAAGSQPKSSKEESDFDTDDLDSDDTDDYDIESSNYSVTRRRTRSTVQPVVADGVVEDPRGNAVPEVGNEGAVTNDAPDDGEETSRPPAAAAAPSVAFSENDLVIVQVRRWPGVNKDGGVARITKVRPGGLYDLQHVVGSKREKKVEASFLSPLEEEQPRSDILFDDPPQIMNKKRERKQIKKPYVADSDEESDDFSS